MCKKMKLFSYLKIAKEKIWIGMSVQIQRTNSE